MKNHFYHTKVFFFLLITLLSVFISKAQVGLGTNSPNARAMLDIRSTTRGVLPPRMTPAQRTTLAASLTKTERGLMVADSVTGRQYYWDSAKWTHITPPVKLPLTLISDSIAINPGTANGDLVSWDGVNWINKQPAPVHFTHTVYKMQPFLVLNYCIALNGIFPSRNGIDPFLAEIAIYSFNFPPRYWAYCDGQLLPIGQNTGLFSLLGTTYGGNGQTTFALPDLRGRTAMHFGQGPGLTPRDLGEKSGTETQTISQ